MGKPTIIFDFDGTLANSVDLILDLYNEHAQNYGYLPIDRDEIPMLRRLGYKKAMRIKKIRYYRVPRMIMVLGREMRARMDEVKPYEGIVETLKSLHASGYSVGVLTSNQAAVVTQFFAEHTFPLFDFVVSEKTLFGKDKALKKIMQRYGLQRSDVIYVGDEPRDVVASRKAGVKVIGVTWGLGGIEGFESFLPDVLVTKPQEIPAAVKSLIKSD